MTVRRCPHRGTRTQEPPGGDRGAGRAGGPRRDRFDRGAADPLARPDRRRHRRTHRLADHRAGRAARARDRGDRPRHRPLRHAAGGGAPSLGAQDLDAADLARAEARRPPGRRRHRPRRLGTAGVHARWRDPDAPRSRARHGGCGRPAARVGAGAGGVQPRERGRPLRRLDRRRGGRLLSGPQAGSVRAHRRAGHGPSQHRGHRRRGARRRVADAPRAQDGRRGDEAGRPRSVHSWTRSPRRSRSPRRGPASRPRATTRRAPRRPSTGRS